eukprot:GGOE01045351.1.p1 GENE.GGOE01045351.1~~GGOE01045351.1.p1  ORF type:complete len:424 (+),score=122.65 GGOE01045351.1:74-1345(+)
MSHGSHVHLHLYDITMGMAAKFSPGLLGKRVEAIWHTGIAAYGKEYFFEGGITCVPAATTRFGRPMDIIPLGRTEIPQSVFEQWTLEMEVQKYGSMAYHITRNNCNHFTHEASLFLTGRGIPDWILSMPEEVLNTPLGTLLCPVIDTLMDSVQQQLVQQERVMLARAGLPPKATLQAVMLWSSTRVDHIGSKLRALYGTVITEESLGELLSAVSSEQVPPEAATATLCEMRASTVAMHWVVLDVLRLLVLRETFVRHACRPEGEALAWLEWGIGQFRTSVTACRVMVLRLIGNLFATDEGCCVVFTPPRLLSIVDVVCFALAQTAPLVRITAAAVAHNVAVRAPSMDGDAIVQLFTALCQFVEAEGNWDASHTILTALGRFLGRSTELKALFQSLAPRLEVPGRCEEERVRRAAQLVFNTLLS